MSTIFSYCLPATGDDIEAELCQFCNRGAPAPSPSVLVIVVLTGATVVTPDRARELLALAALVHAASHDTVFAGRVTATWAVAASGTAWAGITDHDIHGRQSERVVEVMHLRALVTTGYDGLFSVGMGGSGLRHTPEERAWLTAYVLRELICIDFVETDVLWSFCIEAEWEFFG